MSANDKQIAGDHYKTSYQHWDMIVSLGFGPEYYVGQATKYLTRWRKKNGVRDLRKGQHFIEKLLELVEQRGRRFMPLNVPDDIAEEHVLRHMSHLEGYFKDNDVDNETKLIITAVAFANSTDMLKEAIAECDKLALTAASTPTVDAETPVSRDFEFHGYENDDIKWRCKKCGEHMTLGLDQPPIKHHKCDSVTE